MKNNILTLIIVCVIIYCIGSIISENFSSNSIISENFENDKQKRIPKKIWTYWNSDDIPELVKLSIESWHKYNPNHEIVILKDDTLKDYLPDVDFTKIKFIEKPQRKSDFIRLYILQKYGGFWIDASTLMTQSLDFIHDLQEQSDVEFVGYYLDMYTNKCHYPIIESWFLASVENSTFITKWLNAFLKLNNHHTIDDYLKYINDYGVDLQNLDMPDYLTIHVACQDVLQKEMTPEEIQKTIKVLRAEDGPLKYLANNEWNSSKSLQSICVFKASLGTQS